MTTSATHDDDCALLDVHCTAFDEAAFQTHCLDKNLPCIVRGCGAQPELTGLRADGLRRALAAVEAAALKAASATTADAPATLTADHHHHRCDDDANDDDDDDDDAGVASTLVDVEVSPGEYRTMSIAEFCHRNRGLLASLVCNEWALDEASEGEPATAGWYLKDWRFLEWFHTRYPPQSSAAASASASSSSSLYDLPHFMRRFASDDAMQRFQRHAATTKAPRESDGAKLACPQQFGPGGEYRFVYAGGAGSRTLPHFDVCATYSWSISLSGVKRWRFVKSVAANEALLCTHFLAPPPTPPLLADMLDPRGGRGVEIIQRPGDVVFVPAMWVHEVQNLTACVSANANWYAFPWSARHIMRLLTSEAEMAARMVDEAAVAALRQCGEWEATFNTLLHGSGAWSLSAVRCLFEFSRAELQQQHQQHRQAAAIDALDQALSQLQDLERRLVW